MMRGTYGIRNEVWEADGFYHPHSRAPQSLCKVNTLHEAREASTPGTCKRKIYKQSARAQTKE